MRVSKLFLDLNNLKRSYIFAPRRNYNTLAISLITIYLSLSNTDEKVKFCFVARHHGTNCRKRLIFALGPCLSESSTVVAMEMCVEKGSCPS